MVAVLRMLIAATLIRDVGAARMVGFCKDREFCCCQRGGVEASLQGVVGRVTAERGVVKVCRDVENLLDYQSSPVIHVNSNSLNLLLWLDCQLLVPSIGRGRVTNKNRSSRKSMS